MTTIPLAYWARTAAAASEMAFAWAAAEPAITAVEVTSCERYVSPRRDVEYVRVSDGELQYRWLVTLAITTNAPSLTLGLL